MITTTCYNNKKKQLEASMLEYTEQMNRLQIRRNDSKTEHHSILSDSMHVWAEEDYIPCTNPQHTNVLKNMSPLETTDLNHDLPHKRKNSSTFKKKKRPSSFDESELKRERSLALLRPVRNIKSDRAPAVSKQSWKIPHIRSSFQVSLIDAADLFHLVRPCISPEEESNKSRSQQQTLKNIEDFDTVVQLSKNGFQQKTKDLASFNDMFRNKRQQNCIDLTNLRIDSDRIVGDELFCEVKTLTKLPSLKNQYDINSNARLKPYNYLKVRPKRAKRMQLHKPKLLAIPEDSAVAKSTSSQKQNDNEMVHQEISSNVAMSLKTIKNNSHRSAKDKNDDRTRTRRNLKEEQTFTYSLKKCKKDISINKQSLKDYDNNLVTSPVYPIMPWEIGGKMVKLKSINEEKTDYRTKAHKKMKKLIFLRDKSDKQS